MLISSTTKKTSNSALVNTYFSILSVDSSTEASLDFSGYLPFNDDQVSIVTVFFINHGTSLSLSGCMLPVLTLYRHNDTKIHNNAATVQINSITMPSLHHNTILPLFVILAKRGKNFHCFCTLVVNKCENGPKLLSKFQRNFYFIGNSIITAVMTSFLRFCYFVMAFMAKLP